MTDNNESRRRRFRWLRITFTVAAFVYLGSRIDPRQIVDAWKNLTAGAMIGALLFVAGSNAVGAVRWREVLKAYGAAQLPSWPRTIQLYMVGFFYNTYVPGGLGGDLVRGIASREAFGQSTLHGATGGVTVVLVERICGVAALLGVSTVAFLLRPIPGVDGVTTWAALGLLGATAAVVGVAIGPRLGRHLPGKVGELLCALPTLRRWRPFAMALLLSVFAQAGNVLAGHTIIAALAPSVQLGQSAVIMPLIGAASFFPLTVGGAGVREAAFAALYGTAGVAEATAYAGSLCFWATQLVVAGIGGVLNFVVPIGKVRDQG